MGGDGEVRVEVGKTWFGLVWAVWVDVVIA
jgi:hypothetical protein